MTRAALLAAVPLLALLVLRRRRRLLSCDEAASDTTLDPSDFSSLRRHAHKLLDAAFDHMELARDASRRVWTPPPEYLKERMLKVEAAPAEGAPLDAICQQLTALLPYGSGNTHPRFFGWVQGSGAPGNLLGEIIANAMNANCGGRDHIALYVEKQVLMWSRVMMGFPTDCGALLTSGTSVATIIALKCARDAACGFACRQAGVDPKLVGYTSAQVHSCIKRAFDILGLGVNQLRLVKCSEDFTIDMAALRQLVQADRAAGLKPFLVAGTAGSVNVGAIDDLNALADFAAEEKLWFHVDGAYGAPAVLSPAVRPKLRGLERAHSLAFDYHKWLHVNYDAGCVLVREHKAHLHSFSERPDCA